LGLSLSAAAFANFQFMERAKRSAGYLAKLAVRYGSDKWGSHWYAPHYQTHFARFRWKRITLLEIGIGGDSDVKAGGGSLRAWKSFFPRAKVVGVDLYDKSAHRQRRIRTYQGDQADATFLKNVVAQEGPPDIIVDDGSHINEHVIRSFKTLFPLLKDGGIYAIEDTQTSYWPKYGGQLRNAPNSAHPTLLEFFKQLTDGLNHAEFLEPDYAASYYDNHIVAMHFYHNLLFIYKGMNDEGSNCVRNGYLRC